MERQEYEQKMAAAETAVEELREEIHNVYKLDVAAIERRRLLEAAHKAAAAAGREVEMIRETWAAERLAERLEYVAALERRLK